MGRLNPGGRRYSVLFRDVLSKGSRVLFRCEGYSSLVPTDTAIPIVADALSQSARPSTVIQFPDFG